MESNSAADKDCIRRAAISRRGGVRVRGGRLPPVLLRNSLSAANNKKVFTPNIPQRRVKVKQEVTETVVQSNCGFKNDVQNTRGRGRGRGSKVYLQTEGSFLEQGPALKIKKEPQNSQYEKAAYSKYSTRGSSKVKTGDIKIESGKIMELLEDYNVKEEFPDLYNPKKPVRLPFVKVEAKVEIKKEIIEDEYIKPVIKKELPDEKENKWSPLEGKFFTRIKNEDVEQTHPPEDFKFLQDRKSLILMQLPTCLPFGKADKPVTEGKSSSLNDKKLEDESGQESFGTRIADVPEGCVGKLQIMKSGQMRVVMGSVIMTLEHGTDSETLWEVVSIPTTGKDEGDLIVLGRVDRKMVLRPVLNHMMLMVKSEITDEKL